MLGSASSTRTSSRHCSYLSEYLSLVLVLVLVDLLVRVRVATRATRTTVQWYGGTVVATRVHCSTLVVTISTRIRTIYRRASTSTRIT
eukprot:scaffold37302_cov47-Prasinocladus_malaysianus.AAC.1